MFDTARPLLNEALAIRTELLGDDNAEVAASLHNLGWLDQDEGQFASAQKLYRRALVMRRKHLGDSHPAVTATMFNLAWVTGHQFDFTTDERRQEAESLLRSILERQTRWPNGGHGDPIVTRLALVMVIYTPDNAHKGEVDALLKEVMILLPKYASSKPIIAAGAKYITSRRMWDDGDRTGDSTLHDKAIKLRHEVLDEMQTLFGNDHMLIAYLRGDLAGLLNKRGQLDEAEKQFQEAMRIGKRYFPQGHWLMARTLIEAADQYARVGRRPDAERHYRDAMTMAAKVGRPELWTRARDGLVSVLRAEGRIAEAEELVKQNPPKVP
ncbi:MAG: tetratricopeptide repeat protein [Planctomycetia bacterium]|nr:tetratricopeptide repeat protein [Planctomycetia bacterium]